MQKTYFFDLDGTLVSSVNPVKQVFREYLAQHYHFELTEEFWKTELAARGYMADMQFLKERFQDPTPAEEMMQEFYSRIIPKYESEIFFKPHAKEFLQKLHDSGVKTYLFSASPMCMITPCLKNNGAEHLFTGIISVDRYSPLTKRDVALWQQAAKDCGIDAKDAVIFEDNVVPIQTALKAGYTVYAVKDVQPKTDFELLERIAHHVVYDYAELL